jgi:type II secretory pathway pseudopilin PulG
MKNSFSQKNGLTLIELMFILIIITILVSIGVNQFSIYKTGANDAVAKNDLKNAHKAAMGYFMEHPAGRVTKKELETYGFMESAKVNLQIFNGTSPGLLIGAANISPDSRIFIVDVNGNIIQPSRSLTQCTSIGQLGSPHVPPGEPAGNTSNPTNSELSPLAQMELQLAYGAALSYFFHNPDGVVSKSILEIYGYSPNNNVNLTIADGSLQSLRMLATSFDSGGQTLLIDSAGSIY